MLNGQGYFGVYGKSDFNIGVYGKGMKYGGFFEGDLMVTEDLTVGGKIKFQISAYGPFVGDDTEVSSHHLGFHTFCALSHYSFAGSTGTYRWATVTRKFEMETGKIHWYLELRAEPNNTITASCLCID